MLNLRLKLNQDVFLDENKKAPRNAFGDALLEVAEKNNSVVALGADLSESVRLENFFNKFPERFIHVGIAEQNMCSIATGLAMEGKIPFVVTHTVFLTSRAWDQIKLSICMTNANVKICGSHEGFSNGPDGAPGEPLEDIAIMRVLPNITVVNPIDYEELS